MNVIISFCAIILKLTEDNYYDTFSPESYSMKKTERTQEAIEKCLSFYNEQIRLFLQVQRHLKKSKGDLLYVVHIPSGWPGQIAVKSKENKSLSAACKQVRGKFEAANAKHKSFENFARTIFVFVKVGKENLLMLVPQDAMRIITEELGGTSQFSFGWERFTLKEPGRVPMIFNSEAMPSHHFA